MAYDNCPDWFTVLLKPNWGSSGKCVLRVDEALRLNASLATAYSLKEDLRQI